MIFLDNNATTALLPEVLEAMLLDLDGIPRNPSSITKYGRDAREKISSSRRLIANYFGVAPEEVYFTSGGTESNHMLIHGFYLRKAGPIISTKIEHACVLGALEKYHPLNLNVGETGAPHAAELEELLKTITPSFVMLTAANTETGVMLDLEKFASICASNNVPLVLDGVGLPGKVSCKSLPKGIAGISFSGHKFHGPKGIGFVIIRKQYKIPPIFKGGHQERDMRAGTENVAGILGLAKAISLIDESAFKRMEDLRDYFEKELLARFPHFKINGTGPRLPNTSNIYFKECDAETLLMNLDQKGLIASLGSACSANALAPSHVLLGMNLTQERALSSLRFSLSRFTTKQEIDTSLTLIASCLPPTRDPLARISHQHSEK
jgi:cysteine desulfurase